MKQKKYLLIFQLLILSMLSKAQVKTNFNNQTQILQSGRFVKNYVTQIDYELPAQNIKNLLEIEKTETAKSIDTKPFQLAIPISVDIDIAKLTQWTYDESNAYGKFSLKLNGALSSSINFDKFYLPKGTEMFLYNENGNMITGAVTENENNANKLWGSWVYKGEFLNIEIKTPMSSREQLLLHANNIAYGYKEVYKNIKVGGFGQSGACNINVLCPLGNGWEAERNSVSLILSDNGSTWCSGSMIMNTCSTNRPFYLTANHCFVGQNVAAWRFTFQAWSPNCSPSQNSDGVTFNGSTLRANWAASDFCLVELNNTPANNLGINYAGWNRGLVPTAIGTGIHHPSGDVMKISRANSLLIGSYNSTTNLHWKANWVQGITEGGSSGSPLFDQNHRIVGQLQGGPSACGGSQLWDFYGRFDVSWTGGGSPATRLSSWLDESNGGALTTNTTNILNLVASNNSLTISGDASVCTTSNSYSIPNLPIGSTVQWTTTPIGLVTINSPNALQTTLTNSVNGVITLTARVTPICGTPYDIIKNNIIAGKGAAGVSITLLNATCEYTSTWTSYFYGVCKEVPGAISYNWYTKDLTISSNPYKLKGYDFSTDFPLKPGNRRYNIKLIITTPCGDLETIEQVTAPNCINGAKIQLNPNPVTNTLNINVIEDKENLSNDIQEMIISDKMGNKLIQKKYTIGTKKISFQINNLKPDIYFVKTWDGKTWEVIQFIKQ